MSYIGELSAVCTACLWSCSSMIVASAVPRVGSVAMNIARLLVAALLLLATILFLGIGIRFSSSQAVNLALSGLSGILFGDTFLFAAYNRIGARLSMLLMSLSPGLTALLGFIYLGERMSWHGVAGMLVTMAGILTVVLQSPEQSGAHFHMTRTGLIFGLLAALGQSVGFIFAKLAFNESTINGFAASFLRIALALAILFPLSMFFGWTRNPVQLFLRDRRALMMAFLGGSLGSYLGITLSLVAVEHAKVGVAATILATPPIMMLPLSGIFHRERHSWKTVAGAVLAVAGVAVLFLR